MSGDLPVSRRGNSPAGGGSAISIARSQAAREIVAVVIAERGPAALPILERIEAEIAAAQAAECAVERARAIVAAGGRFKPAGRKAG